MPEVVKTPLRSGSRAHVAETPKKVREKVERIGLRGLLWLLVFAVALGFVDYFLIAPNFSYLGFSHETPTPGPVAILTLSYLFAASRLPVSWERPSTLIYWMLFALVVAPIHVVPAFMLDRSPATWGMVFSISSAFFLLGFVYSIRPQAIPRPALPKNFYWFFVVGIWLALIAVVISQYGFHFQLVSLADIYEVRSEFRDTEAEMTRVMKYALPWLGFVVAPLGMAYGFLKKNWFFVAGGILTELFLVGVSGFKSLLFSSLLVALLVVMVMMVELRKFGKLMPPLLACSAVGVFAVDWLTNGYLLSSIFIRRLMLTAGVNTNYYFEFFWDRPKAQLGHGLLAGVVDYPYPTVPAKLIGILFYGSDKTNANANLWADAFSNFGIWGVLGFTVLLALLLLVIDATAVNLPRALAMIVLAMPALSLSNSALLTTLLTHGVLLAVVLLYLMPVEKQPIGMPRPRKPGHLLAAVRPTAKDIR
jgi:hypothetical protein